MVGEGLAGNDQIRGTANTINSLDNYILSGGSGSDVASLSGNADDTNVLLGGAGTDVNRGSLTSVRDICSAGDINTDCELNVGN
jgi:hypothetical protein